jgi:small subunit ribosomal protein S8
MRNAIMAGHVTTSIPYSRLKLSIAQILKEEGFIEDFDAAGGESVVDKVIRVKLKYVGVRRERHPVMTGMERVSTPGRRVYVGKGDIPWVLSGMGVAIVSTPKGVMTGQRARSMGVGGEVLCHIW